MDSGSCGFARRIKSAHIRFAVEIGPHSTHAELRRRTHRNHILRNVQVMRHAGLVDSMELFLHRGRSQMGQIQVHEGIFGMADLHLVYDGAQHEIAWRPLSGGMVFRHKPVQLEIAQVAALLED